MSSPRSSRTPYEIIEEEKEAYLEEKISEPDPDWPLDVRIVYNELHDRVFEMGLEAQEVVEACGIGDHNIYTRFKYFAGYGIKEWILEHRINLSKNILDGTEIPVGQVALSVGYENPSGFSATFKRHEGDTSSEYRSLREG